MGVRVTPPSTIKVQVGSTSQPRVTSLSYGGSFALKNATDLSMLGAQDGDVIVEFNGVKIDTMRKLPKVVGESPVGKSATFKVWRNKKIITKTIVLGRLEDTEEFKKKSKSKKVEKKKDTLLKSLGAKVRNITDQDIASRKLKSDISGVIVQEIQADGALSDTPIQVGDIIVGLKNEKVKNVSDFEDKLKKIIKSGNASILLTILDSKNRSRYVGVKIN